MLSVSGAQVLLRTSLHPVTGQTRPSLLGLRRPDVLLSHLLFGALITARATRQDIIAKKLRPLSTPSTLRKEPIESTLPNEPMDPIEKLEPMDPIEKDDL